MRRAILFVALVAFALGSVTPGATAITYGEHDTEHPNVGALLWDPDLAAPPGPELYMFCSGSLIAPQLFLTAAHCLDFGDPPASLFVSFDADLGLDPLDGTVDPSTLIGVTGYAKHPGFRYGGMSTAYNDVGVVVLAQAVTVTPVELPEENFLTEEAAHRGLRGQVFVNVGYGVGLPTAPVTSPKYTAPFDGFRWVSWSPFKALTAYHLHLLANNTTTGGGGSCFGDSGSPKFYGEGSNLAVAVTTSVDPGCKALSQNQRLDTPAVYEFLQSFL